MLRKKKPLKLVRSSRFTEQLQKIIELEGKLYLTEVLVETRKILRLAAEGKVEPREEPQKMYNALYYRVSLRSKPLILCFSYEEKDDGLFVLSHFEDENMKMW